MILAPKPVRERSWGQVPLEDVTGCTICRCNQVRTVNFTIFELLTPKFRENLHFWRFLVLLVLLVPISLKLLVFVQKLFLTNNYFHIAEIDLTTRSPWYTCLVLTEVLQIYVRGMVNIFWGLKLKFGSKKAKVVC